MDISRVSAVVLAVLAAVLVIVAGKSCTDDIENTNRRTKLKNNKVTTAPTFAPEVVPFNAETTPLTEPPTETETLPYDVVTNMLGTVIETIPKSTNENGEIETTQSTETKSILQEYEERRRTTAPPQPETEPTTSKYIKPADHIVIEIG